MKEFQVLKNHLSEGRLQQVDFDLDAPLDSGSLVVKVDKFGFSANNITYGAIGEQLGYWQFFPPGGDDTDQWGIIPVWGFADVVASNVEGVEVGERLFGYFPPSHYLTMQNVNASEHRVLDGAPHRSQLPVGYNTYRRLNKEPGYDRATDNLRMLLAPLHLTSYCLWDRLSAQHWHDAEQILIVSASSKTSIGLGYALANDGSAPTSVGLTSSGNRTWVEGLNTYDAVVSYDQLDTLDTSKTTVIVDMSGNSDLLAKLQAHLADKLSFCLNVGLTHWDEAEQASAIAEHKREFFFAPAHIQKRIQDWGPADFEQKTGRFLRESAMKSMGWMKIRELQGVEGLADVYTQVCAGKIPPEQGLVIQLD